MEQINYNEVQNDPQNPEKKKKDKKPGKQVSLTLMIVLMIIIGFGSSIITFKVLGGGGEVATVQTSDTQSMDNNELITTVQPAVFTVVNYTKIGNQNLGSLSQQEYEQGVGSGFTVYEDKGTYYLLTNFHVIEGATSIVLIDDAGNEIEAEVVAYDSNQDLALLSFKSAESYPILKIAPNSDEVFLGQVVYTFGSPMGSEFSNSVSQGIVSGLNRTLSDNGVSYIQTDATINPGNSGGPLVTSDGTVIGVNSMKISDQSVDNMGFAISPETINDFLTRAFETIGINWTEVQPK